MTTISDLDPLDIGIDSTSIGHQDPLLIRTGHAHEIGLLEVSARASDSNSSYYSVGFDEQTSNQELQEADIEANSQTQSAEDLCSLVPGMYRILDLICEHSANGLVDKIVVAQDSFTRFLNEISPGACMSLTKVDFEALDKFQVKFFGIYGSKAEIVRFLIAMTVIDDTISKGLALRSGLYICRVPDSASSAKRMCIIYWPEDSTWDDGASPSVRQNCLIFMRFLTKLCDQVTALVPDRQANSASKVSETKRPKKVVCVRRGFECIDDELFVSGGRPKCHEDPELLKPRLLLGETKQGVMTMKYVPVRHFLKSLDHFDISAPLLQDALTKRRLQISESISPESLDYLVRLGLGKRFPDTCIAWTKAVTALKSGFRKDTGAQQKKVEVELNEARTQTEMSIRFAVADAVFSHYPTLDRSRCFVSAPPLALDHESRLSQSYSKYTTIHSHLAVDFANEVCKADCTNINEESFRISKEKILLVFYLSRRLVIKSETQLTNLVRLVFNDSRQKFHSTLATIHHEIAIPTDPSSKPTAADRRTIREMLREGRSKASLTSDPEFIADLEGLSSTVPALRNAVAVARDQAQQYLESIVDKLCQSLSNSLLRTQEDTQESPNVEVDCPTEQDLCELGRSLILRVNFLSQFCDSPHSLRIVSVDNDYNDPDNFVISGELETLNEACLLLTIHPMNMTTQDQHGLQLDPTQVPNPHFREPYSFRLSVGFSVSHVQLLEGDRVLLVLIDQNANLHIYFDHLTNIENSIRCERGKMLHPNEIGRKILLAFDESQARLAVISCEELQLHVFVHDDSHGFTASGSAIDLNPWYNDGTTIQKTCFASGSDELLLVDSQAIASVFSIATMQFRPASLNLYHVPIDVHSSPDGSYILVVTSDDACSSIIAYPWSTFGSTDGIPLPITEWAGDGKFVISSLASRNAVHLLKLDLSTHTCSSVVLDITSEVTESMLEEKDDRDIPSRDIHPAAHNSVVDCHVDVWTHFPILPAVQRVTSSHRRRSIRFVADRDHARYPAHFSDVIDTFEQTSKKPTGDTLKAIHVSATTFDSFVADFSLNGEWDDISSFKIGELTLEILCLVPIHLALVRDNEFIPLRDGRYCPDAERSLLGADINHTVDSISLGWYESIFKSYMPDKSVRVVSSIGEQYVGKCHTLDHLVDASFTVSTTREGVWMSVTPTEEELIVALDFQYTERSSGEDIFALFSMAISNLVLFHTSFTLGDDISGLFNLFQSRSVLLDSLSDPLLFQSTLVIIIKDTTDSSKKDTVRELSHQFQEMVGKNPDGNFISRFHGGKLNIVPWPIIESSDFYRPFMPLKTRLDEAVTHQTAREFLHTMKLLMAKIKAKDWEELSQTRASYDVHRSLTLLPSALAFGVQCIESEIAELQILNTSTSMDSLDVDARFFLPSLEHSHLETPEQVLGTLLTGWELSESRQMIPDIQWAGELSRYLEDLADMRADHVRAWVTSNLTHLQDDLASVEEIQQALERSVIDLKASVQLCMAQCASCQLLCIRNQSHEGMHDCRTTHACAKSCECCSEAGDSQLEGWEIKKCTMSAGHSGSHLCSLTFHLCGAPCKNLGKGGCLGGCVKPSDHSGNVHQCGAVTHACDEPCGLCHVRLADGSEHNCKGRCTGSVEIIHKGHQCDAQYCPISCQLCSRLCSSRNHLHALEKDAVHLCEKLHTCSQRCNVPGVCGIETTPESIETGFRGDECFHYTVYSQVARHLKCVKLIPPGKLQHQGSHEHSLDPDVVHYCQAKCPGCQYHCTFPMGHSQEHDTHHGSMSNVRWSIDCQSISFDSQERRLSTSNEGNPMACDKACQALGRHVHIDYCRGDIPSECQANHEIQHITKKINPEPDRPKDYLTHNLFWKRSGFKDPYSWEQREEFAKCDAMCAEPEHAASEGSPAAPSFCILPLFHAPLNPSSAIKQGYISLDGHQFVCRNPASAQQPFHIIFLIDRSMSMNKSDRQPLASSPVWGKIRPRMNNRLGAVYGALHSFWTARQAAGGLRRDANTIILHAEGTQTVCENDTARSANELLDLLLPNFPKGGNAFDKALKAADTAISQWWDNERPPVIIFLSDGIASVSDSVVRKLFNKTAKKGKGLSLHAILFGPKTTCTRMQQMVTVARDAQSKTPALMDVPSSFHEALDSVQLTNTFLDIAESLRKPEGP